MKTSSSYSFSAPAPCLHDTQYGEVKVQLNSTEKGLDVKIETKRLLILSVNTNEYEPQLKALYGDKEVNKLVGTGATMSPELVHQKVQRWIKRWSDKNPFSGYIVLERETGGFVGQIILKPVKDKSKTELAFLPGVAEIGYLSVEKHWKKGYGKEFTHAIVNHLVPALIQQNYKMNGFSVTSLMATAGCNNTASNRILNIFMRFIGEKERYGSPRMWYRNEYSTDGSLLNLEKGLHKGVAAA